MTRQVPAVDLVIISRDAEPLCTEVEHGIYDQRGVDVCLHRVIGDVRSGESCRYQTIARARNEGRLKGTTPWLMFVDDDVVLETDCVSQLVHELQRRPSFAALAADYLGESQERQVAPHVSMGATLFRREVFRKLRFTWRADRCECQCCCDDLRRLRLGIDYWSLAKARHLSKANRNLSTEQGLKPARHSHRSTPVAKHSCRSPTVCLIACYLGPLPPWMDYYLLSCECSPTIDFLILTDQKSYPAGPPNVRFEQLSRIDFNSLATERIGVPISLACAQKLCDFKPTYGHLFADLIEGYDYWGYTDLDVIYGDIRRHLIAVSLEEYDIFSSRQEYLVGHFTLLRNTPRLMTLYRLCEGFRAILQYPAIMSFDECGHQWERLWAGEQLDRFAACESMTHLVRRLVHQGELNVCLAPSVLEWPELPDEGWNVHWTAGNLSYSVGSDSPMYLHFHAFKSSMGYRQPPQLRNAAGFDITPLGFELLKEGCAMSSDQCLVS